MQRGLEQVTDASEPVCWLLRLCGRNHSSESWIRVSVSRIYILHHQFIRCVTLDKWFPLWTSLHLSLKWGRFQMYRSKIIVDAKALCIIQFDVISSLINTHAHAHNYSQDTVKFFSVFPSWCSGTYRLCLMKESSIAQVFFSTLTCFLVLRYATSRGRDHDLGAFYSPKHHCTHRVSGTSPPNTLHSALLVGIHSRLCWSYCPSDTLLCSCFFWGARSLFSSYTCMYIYIDVHKIVRYLRCIWWLDTPWKDFPCELIELTYPSPHILMDCLVLFWWEHLSSTLSTDFNATVLPHPLHH